MKSIFHLNLQRSVDVTEQKRQVYKKRRAYTGKYFHKLSICYGKPFVYKYQIRIHRVHQFTKVEMFSVCNPSQSEEVLEYFRDLQTRMFEKLGFHFVVLDMPPCELGSPAYRKYDIEAWMPGRNMYGEISSCSNCTDYQSMRLDIKIKNNNNDVNYAHTVNGTACAIPRLLITLVENFQNHDGTISIPSELQSYMNGQQVIQKRKVLPELKLVKTIPSEIL